jgi:hypothetical protein
MVLIDALSRYSFAVSHPPAPEEYPRELRGGGQQGTALIIKLDDGD